MNQPTENVLPKTLRFVSSGKILFTPTLRERIAILCGANVLAETTLLSQHKPGEMRRATKFTLTPLKELPQPVPAVIEAKE